MLYMDVMSESFFVCCEIKSLILFEENDFVFKSLMAKNNARKRRDNMNLADIAPTVLFPPYAELSNLAPWKPSFENASNWLPQATKK